MKTRKIIIVVLASIALSIGGVAGYDYYQRGQKTLLCFASISSHPIMYEFPHLYGKTVDRVRMTAAAIKKGKPLFGAREKIAVDYAEQLESLAEEIATVDQLLSPHDFMADFESVEFKSYEQRKRDHADEIARIRQRGALLNARAKELELIFK